MKHIIFFNTKGGVGKSSLCEFSANELIRLGYLVSVFNTDQQDHVTCSDLDDSDFCLYDTAGAFTSKNIELLTAAKDFDTKIIIPCNVGDNDLKELPFLIKTLNEYGYINKSTLVFTRTRNNSKSLNLARNLCTQLHFKTAKWTMPALDDFAFKRITSRTKNEISAFLHEVIL